MATILNDEEIKRLIGKVILEGDPDCIRPNSYILRLGSSGEFLNTRKEFKLGDKKKGVRLPPGHSLALTAHETLDFRHQTVHEIFPDNDLHGLLSPTTDLSREGIVAPSTQVDAGYYGTLNWTITNSSSDERRFVHKERIYRLLIFKLGEGETPEKVYTGDYQSQTGYVPSKRRGAPVGMKEVEWEDAHVKGGPEELLENLIKSGYPWHILGQRLKQIDQQFKTVSDEYSAISDAIYRLTEDIKQIRERQSDPHETVRKVLREEASSLQNRWLIGAGSVVFAGFGIILSIASNEGASQFFKDNGIIIGLILVLVAVGVLFIISRQK